MNEHRVFQIAVDMAVLLFAFAVHECAHAYVAWKCGDSTAYDQGRVTLNPVPHIDPFGSLFLPLMMAVSGSGMLFGWAKPTPVSLGGLKRPRLANFLVSGAGPIANGVLALLSAATLALLPATGPRDVLIVLRAVMVAAIKLNVILLFFNLLPFPPLDGFGVVQSMMPARFFRLSHWLQRYGFVITVVGMVSGILGMIVGLVAVPIIAALGGTT